MAWSVCIFAHNEARRLPGCLKALDAAAAGRAIPVHVMENGSNDATAALAHAAAKANPRIHVHELAVADKANAWNLYLHECAGEASMHVFLDGDVRPAAGAFPALAAAFEANPRALGAAALPAAGRSRREWSRRLFANHYLSGNLYALSGQCVESLRRENFRLPVGAVGEDGLLSYALLTDLKGGDDDAHRDRIAVAVGALFEFDSLGLSLRDLQLYFRRLERYSRRHVQNQILYPILKRDGLAALPEEITTIFTRNALPGVRPRTGPLDRWFDRRTLRAMRRNAP